MLEPEEAPQEVDDPSDARATPYERLKIARLERYAALVWPWSLYIVALSRTYTHRSDRDRSKRPLLKAMIETLTQTLLSKHANDFSDTDDVDFTASRIRDILSGIEKMLVLAHPRLETPGPHVASSYYLGLGQMLREDPVCIFVDWNFNQAMCDGISKAFGRQSRTSRLVHIIVASVLPQDGTEMIQTLHKSLQSTLASPESVTLFNMTNTADELPEGWTAEPHAQPPMCRWSSSDCA